MKKNGKIGYITLDLIFSSIAMAIAIYLINKGQIRDSQNKLAECIVASIIFISISLLVKSYNSLWLYIGFSEVIRQLKASILTGTILIILSLNNIMNFDIYTSIIYTGIVFGISCTIRGINRYQRWLNISKTTNEKNLKRTLIIGAGDAGSLVVKKLIINNQTNKPVAILDDDTQKQGKMLTGIKIVGKISELQKIVKEYQIQEIIIAIPSQNKEKIIDISKKALEIGIPAKMFYKTEDVKDFINGNKEALKEISIEDILSRESVKPDMTKVYNLLKNKKVLVTGGAGSIGAELCKQALEHGCKELAIVDINENGLFFINEELKKSYQNYKIYLASIRDLKRIKNVIKEVKPDIVIHAAAHKHVPIVDKNPFEAIKNNYVGTKNVIEASIENQVEKFILISTDKAVRPTNIMGATKRMGEILVQLENGKNNCQMMAVRFGNVLGSNGSVIPLFKKQIAEGGPITITDKKMQRYFMTIPEAVSLVLSAATIAKGGELFVLNMGKPVNIYQMAKNMITLSGLQIDKDIQIKEIGIRQGEKLYEELTVAGETIEKTIDNKILIMKSRKVDKKWAQQTFDNILKLSLEEKDEQTLTKEIMKFIKEDNKT